MIIVEIIETQSPFVQGLIASAVFALSVLILRIIAKLATKSGSALFKSYQKQLLTRHWLHKNYVNSNNILLYTQGFNFVVLQTVRWVLRGTLIIIFFLGVNSIVNKEWLWAICSWFSFNAFLEAFEWAKDSSSEEFIDKIDEDIKNEFFASVHAKKSESKEIDNKSSK